MTHENADPKIMDRHHSTVEIISQQVALFHKSKTPFRIYHGSTNSTRKQDFDHSRIVDASALNRILRIDYDAKTCLVEPNVPMDALVYATVKHDHLPPVVPEFPGITAGGAFSGTAGESSSFRCGFFDETVNLIEMVLPDGEVVKCSRDERADLFHGAAGAFGTLGIITMLEVRLQQVSEFVEVEIHHVHSAAEAVQLQVDSASDETVLYIDGILFSPSQGAVIIGRDCSSHSHKEQIQRFSRAHDPWFYLYALKTTKILASQASAKPHKILVPHTDYLFRYDRGAFWMGRLGFHLFKTPFNRVTRFVLNPLAKTRKMYDALHHSGYMRRFIIQDLLIPAENTAEFVHWSDAQLRIYPLWLCPIRARSAAPLHTWPQAKGDLLVNVGLWGAKDGAIGAYKSREAFLADNKDIEAKVMQLGGRKWLYAAVFVDENKFWSGFAEGEQQRYDELRQKYGAEWLPSLYEKVRFDEGLPETKDTSSILGAWKGVLKAMVGRNPLYK